MGDACFRFDCTSCHTAPKDSLAARYDGPKKSRHETVLLPRMSFSCRGCHAKEDVVAELWPKYNDAYAKSHQAMVLAKFKYEMKDGQKVKLYDGGQLVRAGGRLRIVHPPPGMETVLPAGAVAIKDRDDRPAFLFWRFKQPPGVPEKKRQ